MKALNPPTPPFARYAHGVEVPAGARIIRTSGQLGLDAAGQVPQGARAQADHCFANIVEILTEGGMRPANVFHVSAFVTDRAHMAGYMAASDACLSAVPVSPASTLMIVSGFTRAEFVVEMEVWAAD